MHSNLFLPAGNANTSAIHVKVGFDDGLARPEDKMYR